MEEITVDVSVSGLGQSVVLLKPLTDKAKEWMDEKISKEGYQPYLPTRVVEHRYVEDILIGMKEDGLVLGQ